MNAQSYTFTQSRNLYRGAPDVLGALRSVGLAPIDASTLRLDGVLCRYRGEGDGPGRLNCWLIAHLDGLRPLIVCGSWRTGEQHTLALDGKPLAEHDRGAVRAAIEAASAERERETRTRQERAQRLAQNWWDSSPPADPAHPYLVRKGIQVHGARQSGGKVLIALRDEHGVIWNVQAIRVDGDKRFLFGARIKGLFATIGTLDGDHLLICEGWATGCSLREATGLLVVVAMTAGNLLQVAQTIRRMFPNTRITICADNDAETAERTGKNVGIEAAKTAAAAIGAHLAIPDHAGDFNDLYLTQRKSAERLEVTHERSSENH